MPIIVRITLSLRPRFELQENTLLYVFDRAVSNVYTFPTPTCSTAQKTHVSEFFLFFTEQPIESL